MTKGRSSRHGAVFVLTGSLLLGCEAAENIAPVIDQITPPDDGTNLTLVSSQARVDPKGWGYADVYFTFAQDPDDLLTQGPASVENANCTTQQDNAPVMDCEVAFLAPLGTWYFQWHIDYGQTGADTATLSRPEPPTDTFTIAVPDTGNNGQPPQGNNGTPGGNGEAPPPVDVPEQDALVLVRPADGDMCAGDFIGTDIETGTVTSPLDWRTESTGEFQSISGNYQLMLERPESPNCADDGSGQSNDGLDLGNPDTAWSNLGNGGCWVEAANTNASATPVLLPNTDYRWRVRRILPAGGFGAWSPYGDFRTASPPPEAPELVQPAGGNALIPETVASADVEFIWRVPGCPPTLFTILYYKDDETIPSPVVQGTCPWNGEQDLCRAMVMLEEGHSYRFEITQSNAFGTISAEYQISTD